MDTKILGTKFEIWAEQLFSDLGYNIRRNLVYYKNSKNKDCKQIDLEYSTKVYGLMPPYMTNTILELKYSSSGKIGLNHWSKRNSINNLAQEVHERKQFVGADYAILVTNQYVTDELKKEAEKNRIKLYDRDKLQLMDKKRASLVEKIGLKKRASLEEQIQSIILSEENLSQTYIKID